MALPFNFRALKRISIAACFARLPVEVDIASEFHYRDVPFAAGDLAIFVSQSGETADTQWL